MMILDAWIVALLISLRIVLVGWVWMVRSKMPVGQLCEWMRRGATAVAVGLVLNLIPALLLAPVNLWSPVWDWAGWTLLLVAGLFRMRVLAVGLRPMIAPAATLIAVLTLLSGVVLMLPVRSEWLAGGWDPGVYQANAVRIASQNGIQAITDTIYAALSPEEITLLSRGSEVYREIMPGLPIVIEDGRLPLYYFHFTPLCGAWLFRLGGMNALLKMPVLLGVWMLWLAWALFDRLGLVRWRAWAVILSWMMSPLWWYHQAIPTTELLYTFLFLGGLLCFVDSAPRIPIASGLLFFAGTVNHLNFPVVWGMLFCVFAVGGIGGAGRRPAQRIAFSMVAVAIGIVWDLVFANITVIRLQEKDQILGWILGPFLVLGMVAIVAAWKPPKGSVNRFLCLAARRGGLWAGAIIAVAPLVLLVIMRYEHGYARILDLPLLGTLVFRMSRFQLFLGIPYMVWTGWGLCILSADHNPARRPVRVATLALGGIFMSFLLNPGIAEIYPWAFRRYLVVGLPLVATCQAMTILQYVECWKRRTVMLRVGFAVLLLFVVGGSLPHVRTAARMGEYVGLDTLLKELNSYIDPGDVVVADDPRWGTPLMLMYGHDVVNGRFLWDRADAAQREGFIQAIARIESDLGRRVVWLTSTDVAMEIYAFEHVVCIPLMPDRLFEYRTVIHSSSGSHFALRDNHRIFNLYHCRLHE